MTQNIDDYAYFCNICVPIICCFMACLFKFDSQVEIWSIKKSWLLDYITCLPSA